MSLVLSPQELIDLTGYRQKKRQADWLRRHKFSFKLARDGGPRVDRAHYLGRMGGGERTAPAVGPNWNAMKEPTS